METKKLSVKPHTAELYSWIFDILPYSVSKAIAASEPYISEGMTEIRLRADGISTVTSKGLSYVVTENGISQSVKNCIRLSEKDIDDYIYKLCGGSVYAYENSIACGYITVNGIRNGLSGSITVKDGRITGYSSVKSVNIRLPHHISGCADKLLEHILTKSMVDGKGILAVSRPGVGKTTVLRELAIRLSGEDKNGNVPKRLCRVSVIDERCELYIPSLFTFSCADIFTGIPKHTGIELASRAMSPEIIIFDEIGSDKDAEAVISAHFGGITFVSSVHADSPESAIQNRTVKKLCDEGIFDFIYFLKRTASGVEGTLHRISDLKVKEQSC